MFSKESWARAPQRSVAHSGIPSGLLLLPQTGQAGLGGGEGTSHPCAHLELQVAGCMGPHGLYTLVGGQVRSVGTERCQTSQGVWGAQGHPHSPHRPLRLRGLGVPRAAPNHRTGHSERPRSLGGPGLPPLTAEAAGCTSPVTAHSPGAAELCVSLQALAGHLEATPAVVTDAGVEEWARGHKVVALSKDPVGQSNQDGGPPAPGS